MNNEFIKHDEWIGVSLTNLKFEGFLCCEGNCLYILKFNTLNSFFGMSYDKVTLFTNTTKKITSVSILFPEIIKQLPFDEMIKMYGEPNAMFVSDKIIKETKTENLGGFKQNLVKREFSTRPVKFQDNPKFLIWKKSDFQIKAQVHHEYKATRIMFMRS